MPPRRPSPIGPSEPIDSQPVSRLCAQFVGVPLISPIPECTTGGVIAVRSVCVARRLKIDKRAALQNRHVLESGSVSITIISTFPSLLLFNPDKYAS
jgi:hypothetical protein